MNVRVKGTLTLRSENRRSKDMERYITDEEGRRTAVVLSIEEFEALVEAAEDAEDARAVDEIRAVVARGEDEMVPYRQAREEWTTNTSAGRE
jgi:PHD/YefM family antitoxin component YafN of YafNO toxin-antitoxin module